MRAPLLLALAAGCTFEPGSGFASLDEVSLALQAPELPLQTDQGHTIAVDTWTITSGPLQLQELVGGGGTFDPAAPPPGYSLCHNGHCHADDGSLPTYAEIEAELAGDTASWQTVVSLPVDRLDALDPAAVALGEVRPSAELPAADIGHLALPVQRVQLTGRITSTTPELPLTLDVAQDALVEGSLSLPVDRATESSVRVQVAWALPETLLDGIDWEALAVDGEVVLDDPDSSEAQTLATRWIDSALTGDQE